MKITVEALSPIKHQDVNLIRSNFIGFRTMPMIHKGNIYDVPVVSGNSLRGTMRRLLGHEFVELTGLHNIVSKQAFDKLYNVLAVGGTLTGNSDKNINTDNIRTLRQMIPTLSLFGGAIYKFILPGMVNVGFLVLNCKELENSPFTIADQLIEISLSAHPLTLELEQKTTEATHMYWQIDAVMKGATFSLEVGFQPQATELERSAFCHCLKLLKNIGGYRARGFGLVALSSDDPIDDHMYTNWLATHSKDTEYINWLVNYAEGM